MLITFELKNRVASTVVSFRVHYPCMLMQVMGYNGKRNEEQRLELKEAINQTKKTGGRAKIKM